MSLHDVRRLEKHGPSLQELTINFTSDVVVDAAFARMLPQLRSIHITGTPIRPGAIAAWKQLEKIKLHEPLTGDVAAAMVAGCPELSEVFLTALAPGAIQHMGALLQKLTEFCCAVVGFLYFSPKNTRVRDEIYVKITPDASWLTGGIAASRMKLNAARSIRCSSSSWRNCAAVEGVSLETALSFREESFPCYKALLAPLTKFTSLKMTIEYGGRREQQAIALACQFASMFPHVEMVESKDLMIRFDLASGSLRTSNTSVLRMPLIRKHATAITQFRLDMSRDGFTTPSDEWAALPNVTHLEVARDMVSDHAFQAILPHPEKITKLTYHEVLPRRSLFLTKRCINLRDVQVFLSDADDFAKNAKYLCELTKRWKTLHSVTVGHKHKVLVRDITQKKLEELLRLSAKNYFF